MMTRFAAGLERQRPAPEREDDLAEAVAVRDPGRRVDEPAARGAHLAKAELGDVAGDGRLDDVAPLIVQRLGELGLCRDALARERAAESFPDARAELMRVPRRGRRAPRSTSGSETTSGGVRRRTRLACRADDEARLEARRDDRAGRPIELSAEQQPGASHLENRGQALEPGVRAWRRCAETRSSSASSIASTTAQAGCARDGVAAEGRGVVARHEAAGGLVGDQERADRQAVREALGERDDVRSHAELLVCEERARSPETALHLVEQEQRPVGGCRARPLLRGTPRSPG